ncbi:MAG: aldo/keto reductase [Clostridiales bacterium]|nr:aldo/keto reductase [Clostridiales bacterium]
MLYKDFKGEKLSALGLGMMRLPLRSSADDDIDEAHTEKMIAYALEHGVNYFDTAWGYHNGCSELVAGKLLSKYPREDYKLASKFPGYDLSNMPKVKEIFEKQLQKCRTEYFDFYLFHNVCEMNIDAYLDPKYGIYDYLIAQRDAGRIKHLGLSVHGSIDVLKRFLDKYGKDMEFCQVQLNWLDWDFQDACKKVELLSKLAIPVWVMEPLRGGKLANLPDKYAKRLKALRSDESAAGFAFRFIQSLPQVGVTLSGMSNFEQLKANIKTFDTFNPVNDLERAELMAIAKEMISAKSLPCTACRYCTNHCPKGIDIPEIIKLYNEHVFSDGGFLAPMALGAIDENKRPSACVSCRSCEAVCPQQIKISEMMKDFVSKVN